MRNNLKDFRIQHDLTQEQIAEKIGCKRATYSAIETGIRAGRHKFWRGFQTAFNIPDGEMYGLMKDD